MAKRMNNPSAPEGQQGQQVFLLNKKTHRAEVGLIGERPSLNWGDTTHEGYPL